MSMTAGTPTVLTAAEWRPLQAAHQARVDALTSGPPGQGRRADPAPGRGLPVHLLLVAAGAAPALVPGRRGRAGRCRGPAWTGDSTGDCRPPAADRSGGAPPVDGGPLVTVDLATFRQARGSQLAFTARLLGATAAAPGQFGCFGLHEWAMVFRQDDGRVVTRTGRSGWARPAPTRSCGSTRSGAPTTTRSGSSPRRPGRSTPLQPDRDSQVQMEQPGCLHASMDVYKWAYKLIPMVPSSSAAGRLRAGQVDPRAGHARVAVRPDRARIPTRVRIETPTGKAEYVAAQREFARAGPAAPASAAGRSPTVRRRSVPRAAAWASCRTARALDSDRGRRPAPGSSVRGTARRRS